MAAAIRVAVLPRSMSIVGSRDTPHPLVWQPAPPSGAPMARFLVPFLLPDAWATLESPLGSAAWVAGKYVVLAPPCFFLFGAHALSTRRVAPPSCRRLGWRSAWCSSTRVDGGGGDGIGGAVQGWFLEFMAGVFCSVFFFTFNFFFQTADFFLLFLRTYKTNCLNWRSVLLWFEKCRAALTLR